MAAYAESTGSVVGPSRHVAGQDVVAVVGLPQSSGFEQVVAFDYASVGITPVGGMVARAVVVVFVAAVGVEQAAVELV